MIIVLCGILADCSDFTEIADYAREKEFFFREALGLLLPNGIPSDDALWRVTRHLKSAELEKSPASCAAGIMSGGPASIHRRQRNAGAIIRPDAIGCQKTIVEKISEEKANNVIALKKNQRVLYEQASAWLGSRKSMLPCHKEIDQGHGRGEPRAVYVCSDTRFVAAAGRA